MATHSIMHVFEKDDRNVRDIADVLNKRLNVFFTTNSQIYGLTSINDNPIIDIWYYGDNPRNGYFVALRGEWKKRFRLPTNLESDLAKERIEQIVEEYMLLSMAK